MLPLLREESNDEGDRRWDSESSPAIEQSSKKRERVVSVRCDAKSKEEFDTTNSPDPRQSSKSEQSDLVGDESTAEGGSSYQGESEDEDPFRFPLIKERGKERKRQSSLRSLLGLSLSTRLTISAILPAVSRKAARVAA